MNSIDKKPNYKEIYTYVKNKFDNNTHFYHGPFDETFFTMRVYESAKEIINKIDSRVNREEILTATILHDVGKIKLSARKLFGQSKFNPEAKEEWREHAKKSAQIAKNYLKRKGHSKEFTERVCYLIENHDNRNMINKTTELKILQDADLIADIGISGFIRPFLFAGKFKRSIISTINYLQTDNRIENGETLNLKESKELGREKMKKQQELAKEILKEIDSELLNTNK